MDPTDNPNWFANNPLDRVYDKRSEADFLPSKMRDANSILVPLWRGDPLVANGEAAFLTMTAREAFPANAPIVFLGQLNGTAHFAIDCSAVSETPEGAPLADIGQYMPIREAAGIIDRKDLSIIGHGRWLIEWHANHPHCARCGAKTEMAEGGAKRQCTDCGAEHFPRSDPVAIVLALHGEACLLGRGPQFPPGMFSALAGFVEAAETPEQAARRELFEEAGVTLTDVRYLYSQPWPFPASLMMGFHADTEDRALTLDEEEIAEALWVERPDVIALLNGEERGGVILPPKFTIARQLIERWVGA